MTEPAKMTGHVDVRDLRRWLRSMEDDWLLAAHSMVATALDHPNDARLFVAHATREIKRRKLEPM